MTEGLSSQVTESRAFLRYYFIDRGKEEDLSVDQAAKEFAAYIYAPIRWEVASAMVTHVVEEGIEIAVEEGKTPDDLTEEDLEKVCRAIGLGFLSAYLDIHKPEDDES